MFGNLALEHSWTATSVVVFQSKKNVFVLYCRKAYGSQDFYESHLSLRHLTLPSHDESCGNSAFRSQLTTYRAPSEALEVTSRHCSTHSPTRPLLFVSGDVSSWFAPFRTQNTLLARPR